MKTTLEYRRGKYTKDDTPFLAALLAKLDQNGEGGKILLPSGTLVCNGLVVPSHITLQGACSPCLTSHVVGTRLQATESTPVLIHKGASTWDRALNLSLRDVDLYGRGDASPVVDLHHSSYFRAYRSNIGNTLGSWVDVKEVWDTRFFDCEFTYGGSKDGSIAGIQLTSPDGEDNTNQIMFSMCRFENYFGTAIGTKGANVNEISITDTKFESGYSTVPHIVIDQGVNFSLSNVQVTGGCDAAIDSLVKITNSQVIHGSLLMEIAGGAASGRQIRTYVSVANSTSINLNVMVYRGQPVPTSGKIIDFDGQNADSVSIRSFTS